MAIWANTNFLPVNADKSEHIVFRHAPNMREAKKVLQIDNVPLPKPANITYLGVTFSPLLSFTEPWSTINNKITIRIAALRSTLKKSSHKFASTLFKSIIVPSVTFSSSTFAHISPPTEALELAKSKFYKAFFGLSLNASRTLTLNLSRNIIPVINPSHPIVLSFPNLLENPYSRPFISNFLNSGLHHRFCASPLCFDPSNTCICLLCDSPASDKFHLLNCQFALHNPLFHFKALMFT